MDPDGRQIVCPLLAGVDIEAVGQVQWWLGAHGEEGIKIEVKIQGYCNFMQRPERTKPGGGDGNGRCGPGRGVRKNRLLT